MDWTALGDALSLLVIAVSTFWAAIMLMEIRNILDK